MYTCCVYYLLPWRLCNILAGIMVVLIDRQQRQFLAAREPACSWSETVERVPAIMYYQ